MNNSEHRPPVSNFEDKLSRTFIGFMGGIGVGAVVESAGAPEWAAAGAFLVTLYVLYNVMARIPKRN
ncbi:MAG TPA: hypothetical protein VLF79_04175 [Candidatus Saccharimonadales bacterium]|nr:hypothetical protein [Candidatus Saccharimonadales bacterium]